MIRRSTLSPWLGLLALLALLACGGGAETSSVGGAPPIEEGGAGGAGGAGGTDLCEPPVEDGDCMLVACDVDGNLVTTPDDDDVPDDGNPCTEDTCVDGVPSHAPVPDGSACANGTCQKGACAECVSALECPGTDDFCRQRTCEPDGCGYVFTAAGTPIPLASQTVGDCHEERCDGAGNVVLVPQVGDQPNDNNECTIDVCDVTVPTHVPMSNGTTCTAGVCFDGQCQGCITPADCGGSDDFCQQRTCTNGFCGVDFAASDTPLPVGDQTSGDCVAIVCDGSGNTATSADPADLPFDANPCTVDACSNGTPTFTPATAGTTCPAGQCDGAGQCVGCVDTAACPGVDTFCGQRTCELNVCGMDFQPAGTPLPSQTAGDCMVDVCDGTGGVTTIADDSDTAPDPSACVLAECQSGTQGTAPAPSATTCGSNRVCDGGGHCALDPVWHHDINGLVRAVDADGTGLVAAGMEDTDAWLAKYADDGTATWAHTFGSFSAQSFNDVAVGPSGDIFAVGQFRQSIDLGGGVFTTALNATDGFVARFDSTGAHVMSLEYSEPVTAVAARPGGGLVAAGTSTGAMGVNVWVTAWDAFDNIVWTQTFFSPTSALAAGLHVGDGGTTHVVGRFVGSIDIGSDTYTGGVSGGFVASLDASGTVTWSHGYGEFQGDVVTDAAANVYVVGDFDFAFTLGSVTMSPSNNGNLLMAFSGNGTPSYGAMYWDEIMSAPDDLSAVERGGPGEILIGGSRENTVGLVKAVSSATGAVSWEHRIFNQGPVWDLARATDGAIYLGGNAYIAKVVP